MEDYFCISKENEKLSLVKLVTNINVLLTDLLDDFDRRVILN